MDRILIVDDKVHDRLILKEILLNSKISYEINDSGCGQVAFDEIRSYTPDLIILDTPMSYKPGVLVLEDLHKHEDAFIPVLLISSFSGQEDRLKCLEMGATDFISKPITPEEVIARVAALIKMKKFYDDKKWLAEKTNQGIKLLYKELESKNNELEKLDQMKTDFVSTVSHELRTPLAITTEGLSLVLDGIPGSINDKQKKILTTAKVNVDRLRNIITDLLDISKVEAGQMELRIEKCNVIDVLRELEDGYAAVVATKNIQLQFHVPSDPIEVEIDKDKLIQIMNNLLNNAVKFTKEGGAIDVTLEEESSQFLIRVKDSGIGIDASDLDKVFGKFQQFSRTAGPGIKGTGLGLAITKSLVELHHGNIGVQSRPEKGTTFFFVIPKHPPEENDDAKNINS